MLPLPKLQREQPSVPRPFQQHSIHAELLPVEQVWSLKLNSSRLFTIKDDRSYNKQILLRVRYFWQCLGTSAPSSAAHLTVSFFLWDSISNTQGKSRALKGVVFSSKSPFKGRITRTMGEFSGAMGGGQGGGDQGFLVGTEEKSVSPARESLIGPWGKLLTIFFCKKKT